MGISTGQLHAIDAETIRSVIDALSEQPMQRVEPLVARLRVLPKVSILPSLPAVTD